MSDYPELMVKACALLVRTTLNYSITTGAFRGKMESHGVVPQPGRPRSAQPKNWNTLLLEEMRRAGLVQLDREKMRQNPLKRYLLTDLGERVGREAGA